MLKTNEIRRRLDPSSLLSLQLCLLITACAHPSLTPAEAPSAARNATVAAATAEPVLSLQFNGETKKWTRSDLLHSPLLRSVAVENDPAYDGRKSVYSAIRLSELFRDLRIDPAATLLFTCLDGFSAPLALSSVLNSKNTGAIAYLAIEDPSKAWPAIAADPNKTPAPFYLIWQHPELSKINKDEWPFELAGFEIRSPLAVEFPHTEPDPRLPAGASIRTGHELFMKTCFACHTLNGEGHSQMGPDLNIPFNPTEYLQAGFLAQQIRNPQAIRHWPQSKMSGFDRSSLSDQEVQSIIAYLRHMSRRKFRATKN